MIAALVATLAGRFGGVPRAVVAGPPAGDYGGDQPIGLGGSIRQAGPTGVKGVKGLLHRWADRSQSKRLVSIPTLMLVTATTTVSVAFLGTTAAEASTSPVTSVIAAPAHLTVGQSTQLTATLSRPPNHLADHRAAVPSPLP